MLIKTKIIPRARVLEIIKFARSTHFWTQQEASGHQDIFIRNMLQNIPARTHRAASLNRGHMRAERLIEQEYVEHHLLLTTAESVTYVAVQLLKACYEIDRAIFAMLKSEPVPTGAPKPSNKASGHLSNVLRAGGRSDPRAAKLPAPEYDDGRFHRSDHPGRDNVASLIKKMSDPLIAQSASHHLSIDANEWLLR
jgi:hypothetical protein